MKKTELLLVMLVLLLLSLVFAGCEEKENASASNTIEWVEPISEPIKIEFNRQVLTIDVNDVNEDTNEFNFMSDVSANPFSLYLIDITDDHDVTTCSSIIFETPSGIYLELSFNNEQLLLKGDPNIYDEAARIFFEEHLKPLADDYIKSKLKIEKGN